MALSEYDRGMARLILTLIPLIMAEVKHLKLSYSDFKIRDNNGRVYSIEEAQEIIFKSDNSLSLSLSLRRLAGAFWNIEAIRSHYESEKSKCYGLSKN